MKYGMISRGFSMGAQPMDGFVKRHDSPTDKYYDIVEYDRSLTQEEMNIYSMDLIPLEETK